jgi:hypothetical protein
VKESRVMPSPQFIAGALIVLGIVVAYIGAIQSGPCAFANSLEFYGVAAFLVGGGISLLGAWVVSIPAAILGIVLLVIGVVIGAGAGCTIL